MSEALGEVTEPRARLHGRWESSRLLVHVSGAAWCAGGLTVGFVLMTAWWLSVDRSVPYNDAAQHLSFAYIFRYAIDTGQLGETLDFSSYYPPGTYLLGAVATYLGGMSVAAPIIAQNLLYVPLLALACYGIGRMLAGSIAGLLAVLFALGTPFIIEQFHVFMLDIPQAALVAVTIWLLLASRRFTRVGIAALAGLALGWALASKQFAPVYLVGLLGCILVRGGGWRNWRGIVAFVAVALVVGAPWYVRQLMLGQADGFIQAAGPGGDVPPAARPPALSGANLVWYLWATLNGLLFAPLFAFAAVGVGWAVTRVRRSRALDDPTLELLCGIGAAWLLLTLIPHHDMRYTLGLIGYIAALGTVWIVRLSRGPRVALIVLLTIATAMAHMGATFGIGGESFRRLPGNRNAAYGEGVPPRGRVIVYSNHDYMVSGPRRQPDVLAMLRALRRAGVTTIGWEDRIEVRDPYIEGLGLWALARIVGVEFVPQSGEITAPHPGEAVLIRARSIRELGPPCDRFADGSGLWIRVGVAGALPQVVCHR